MANNYDINYDDEQFQKVESDKQNALTEMDETYGNMIGSVDKYYQDQIDASKQWADTQSKLQQDQTDFTIEQINQQKDKAQKDYTKEQSGAYVDWQKQSNQYGSEAEKMASAGLSKTGFSESSQVSMYNTYQNRLATARESFTSAVLNYDNAIKDARLQNNAALADIAYQALQSQLELSLQGFQYKNQLISEQANKKIELENMYYQRWQDVLTQMNTENAMAEEIRQYNQNYQLQLKQFDESVRQFEMEYTQRQAEFKESIRQFDEEIARLKKKDEQEYKLQIQQLEMEKKRIEQEQKNWEAEMALKEKQLAEEKRQFDKLHPDKVYSGTSTSSSSSAKITKSSGGTKTKNTASTTKSSSNILQDTINKLNNSSASTQAAAVNKFKKVFGSTGSTIEKYFGINPFK